MFCIYLSDATLVILHLTISTADLLGKWVIHGYSSLMFPGKLPDFSQCSHLNA